MRLSYIAIVVSLLLFTSCSEEIVPGMNIVKADDIKLSEKSLSKIAYLEKDSLIFVNKCGEELVGKVVRMNLSNESLHHVEQCDGNYANGSDEVMFEFSWEHIVVYLDFAKLNVNFNIRYWSNYYSCCTGEEFDDMVITRNNCEGGNRCELLRLITDSKNLPESLTQSGFEPYNFKSEDFYINGKKSFPDVYQGMVDQNCPVHFYYSFEDAIISFMDNDGEQWDLKNQ